MDLSHTLKALASFPHVMLGGVPAERAGDDRLAFRRLGLVAGGSLRVDSPAFHEGATIPRIHTADGEEVAPPIEWSGVPGSTRELALLVEDPDAPTPNPFVHWVIHGIPADTMSVEEALALGAHEGRTSMLKPRWLGCAPPKGDTPHRYFFQLFALRAPLRLPRRAGRTMLLHALRGNVLSYATLLGTYRR